MKTKISNQKTYSLPDRDKAGEDKLFLNYFENENLEYVSATKRGLNRKKLQEQGKNPGAYGFKNEDGVYAIQTDENYYFLTIDGVGSCDGFEATQTIMEKFSEKTEDYKNFTKALEEINKQDILQARGRLQACLVGVKIEKENLSQGKFISIGDCQSFIIQDGKISHKNELNAVDDPYSEAITGAMGISEQNFQEKISAIDFIPQKQDYLVLATDGVCSTKTLKEQEIRDIIITEKNLQQASKKIITQAESKQKGDDLGLTLVKFK